MAEHMTVTERSVTDRIAISSDMAQQVTVTIAMSFNME
jgi:hypothetical protein